MTIVLTGAGSGGHITPLLAVAHELKRQRPDVRLIYIGQSGDKLGDIPAQAAVIDAVYTVRAGKFRRYHGAGWRQLLDLPTNLQNLRDFFYVLIGMVQSYRLLKRLQPQVIFIKGGFVGVPIGLAAAKLHMPYITHDSDAIPGLANRLIARWAAKHAVALPAEVYNYPPQKTVTTGIPLQADFQPVTPKLQKEYRQQVDVPPDARLLFIIGGGLGSRNINLAIAEALPHLLADFPDLYVVHSVGRANEAEMRRLYDEHLNPKEQGRLRIYDFISDVYRYSGAADLIITRAGATQLAEFALQGRACIVVPSPFLAAGHQLRNAEYLAEQQAAVVLPEPDLLSDANRVAKLASDLLNNPAERQKLAKNLTQFAHPDASRDLARLILELA